MKKIVLIVMIVMLLIMNPVSADTDDAYNLNMVIQGDEIHLSWNVVNNATAYLFQIYQDGVQTKSNWYYSTSIKVPISSLSGNEIKFRVAAPSVNFSGFVIYNKVVPEIPDPVTPDPLPLGNDFHNVALQGAWHIPDNGAKTRFVEGGGTSAIYRQIVTPPNLLYIDLGEKNTFITDDMGMASMEVDRFGNVVWEKKISGQTYFGIVPINSNELLLNMLSYGRMVKINKVTGVETLVKSGGFRDVSITGNGKIITIEAKANGKALLMEIDGTVIWESNPIFSYARGVWQKDNGNILVVDFTHKAYEVDYNTKETIWTFDGMNYPNSIQEMANGNYLITDEHNNRIIEVEPISKEVVRSYSYGLWSPNYARELENGDWLISDTDNHRVIQVNGQNNIVWELSNMHAPNRAVR